MFEECSCHRFLKCSKFHDFPKVVRGIFKDDACFFFLVDSWLDVVSIHETSEQFDDVGMVESSDDVGFLDEYFLEDFGGVGIALGGEFDSKEGAVFGSKFNSK